MKTNDKKIEKLMEAARRVFINDLKDKINEMETLINASKHHITESDIKKLIRFFHSIDGTASTLKLSDFSLIGNKWEQRLSRLGNQKQEPNSIILKDLYSVINSLKKIVKQLDEFNDVSDNQEESIEYVNIPVRGKILLIDDDITILKLLENAFTLEGYKVYICDDSTTAMETIAAVHPDIIILDIIMPQFSGYEILEKIKTKPEYFGIYVIILSGEDDIDGKMRALNSGADDYITKPFVIREAIARVEMIMRRSENYKEKLLKDSLTDAYSRYYFNLRITEEVERFKRDGTVFSIAFIDMDRYKYINDQYGHKAGDYVLKELVTCVINKIRGCDSVFRYGGDEFIVILPETTDKEAYEIIEELREKFNNKYISIDEMDLRVTFSAGIKQITVKDNSIDQLISDADKAMYYAKRCGRNKVVIHDKEMEFRNLKKTLLIVDDENTILKLLKERFSSIGYSVFTAKDGKSAVTMAEEVQPNAILLDLVLPDIDGFEVCKLIKENVSTNSSKIIMLPKQKQKKGIVKGLHCGADDYVTKPFSLEELEARVVKAINNAY